MGLISRRSSDHPAQRPPRSERRKWAMYGGLGLLALILVLTVGSTLSHPLEYAISIIENQYQRWFDRQNTANPLILLSLSFLGGLLASVSPCILALLPVNLSYIGTLHIRSHWDAVVKAGLFVLGTVTVLSLFGLVSAFAGFVLVEFRGYINVVVGLIMVAMGLWLMGVIQLPLPRREIRLGLVSPYGVGLTFALVSSPCASPVLFAVLAAAVGTGSPLMGTLAMICYALGYTMIIFLSSLFTGFAKQSKRLLQHSDDITRLGSLALLFTGVYYLLTGTQWFWGG